MNNCNGLTQVEKNSRDGGVVQNNNIVNYFITSFRDFYGD